MKKLIFITFLLLQMFGCDVSEENNTVTTQENDVPVYQEFSVIEDNSTNIKEPTSEVQEFFLSGDNLNEYLASPEQTVLFSFKTESGKVLSLLTDSEENYLIYRFGKPDKVEFRFPEIVDNTSWEKFYFESYKTDNDYLLHIYFINVDYQYTIYMNEYPNSSADNKTGVQVKSINTNKTTDIRAVNSSITGSLEYFKDNKKVSR
ncbi:MAG: hypothetical protein JXL97_18385 [Bacteroidales bacterium]|nr:hypothetical protein [Bacteroidales bacterium]